MLNRTVLTHLIGKRYTIHTHADGPLPRGLKPVAFGDAEQAVRFITKLDASPGYWQRLGLNLGLEPNLKSQPQQLLRAIGRQLASGRLSLFELPVQATPASASTAPKALKGANGLGFRIAPAAAALNASQRPVKPFTNTQQALAFLTELGATDHDLAPIAAQLPAGEAATQGGARERVAKALCAEELILFKEVPYTKPKAKTASDTATNIPGNRPVELAPRTPVKKQKVPAEPLAENYVDLAYYYADGTGVSGAKFRVIDAGNGALLATGTLPASGSQRVAIPISVSNVEVFFENDPKDVATLVESIPKPLANAPANWFDRMSQGLQDGTDWTWELLQGDFNENPTVGQIITNAVLTMIPVVDQVADARDLVASIKQLAWDKRYNEVGPWVVFFFTLIGLIPIVGSALKGVLKMVWKGAKLDAILQVFNFFMKGNGVKWLKELHGGKLADYVQQAAKIGHDVLDVVSNQLIALKNKLPKFFVDTHQKIQDTLNTLQEVKNRINGQFEIIGQQLNEKLGKALADAGEKIGVKGAAKGKVVKHQSLSAPDNSTTLGKAVSRTASEDKEIIKKLVALGDIDAAREIIKPFMKEGNWNEVVNRLDVSTPEDKAVFWSKIPQKAQEFAEGNEAFRLESTSGGQVLDGWKDWNEADLPWDASSGQPPPYIRELWTSISANFAQNAKGKVNALQNSDGLSNAGSVWNQVEIDILKDRLKTGEVTEVKLHVYDGDTKISEKTATTAEELISWKP